MGIILTLADLLSLDIAVEKMVGVMLVVKQLEFVRDLIDCDVLVNKDAQSSARTTRALNMTLVRQAWGLCLPFQFLFPKIIFFFPLIYLVPPPEIFTADQPGMFTIRGNSRNIQL